MAETEKVCAFDGCKATVEEDDYCHGCEAYTCDRHSSNYEIPYQAHDATLHWAPGPARASER